jgi:hypothetical protein
LSVISRREQLGPAGIEDRNAHPFVGPSYRLGHGPQRANSEQGLTEAERNAFGERDPDPQSGE